MIRTCHPTDAAAICQIYNHYVRETVITFEEEPISTQEMAQRIGGVIERLPWLVWAQNGSIAGYAYATPWRERVAYRFSVETTVYVAPTFAGQGIGTRLYEALIADLRGRSVHSACGVIAMPNPASVALHEKVGFTRMGVLKEIGWKLGRWIDVSYWQLLLPWRDAATSPTSGAFNDSP